MIFLPLNTYHNPIHNHYQQTLLSKFQSQPGSTPIHQQPITLDPAISNHANRLTPPQDLHLDDPKKSLGHRANTFDPFLNSRLHAYLADKRLVYSSPGEEERLGILAQNYSYRPATVTMPAAVLYQHPDQHQPLLIPNPSQRRERCAKAHEWGAFRRDGYPRSSAGRLLCVLACYEERCGAIGAVLHTVPAIHTSTCTVSSSTGAENHRSIPPHWN